MASTSDFSDFGNTIGNAATTGLNQLANQARASTNFVQQGLNNTEQMINNLGGNILDQTKMFGSYGLTPSSLSSTPFSPTDQGYNTTNYKVRLISVLGLKNGFKMDSIDHVIFDVAPTFSESGSVTYTPVQPIHMPGSIQTYKSTESRTFTISATLISRNTADVIKNMKYLQTLRSWRYPFFGNSTSGQSNLTNRVQGTGATSSMLGAPPELLYLYAYSSSNNDDREFKSPTTRVNINRVPVVLSSLTIDYPNDVDYLPSELTPTGNTEPFPVKMTVGVTLLEAHSPLEYESSFDLMAYKNGILKGF